MNFHKKYLSSKVPYCMETQPVYFALSEPNFIKEFNWFAVVLRYWVFKELYRPFLSILNITVEENTKYLCIILLY